MITYCRCCGAITSKSGHTDAEVCGSVDLIHAPPGEVF